MNTYKQIILLIIVTNVQEENIITVLTPGLCELPHAAKLAHSRSGKEREKKKLLHVTVQQCRNGTRSYHIVISMKKRAWQYCYGLKCPCPCKTLHLTGLRMQIWGLYQTWMNCYFTKVSILDKPNVWVCENRLGENDQADRLVADKTIILGG